MIELYYKEGSNPNEFVLTVNDRKSLSAALQCQDKYPIDSITGPKPGSKEFDENKPSPYRSWVIKGRFKDKILKK